MAGWDLSRSASAIALAQAVFTRGNGVRMRATKPRLERSRHGAELDAQCPEPRPVFVIGAGDERAAD